MGHLDDICSTIYNLQKGLHATYTKEKARLNWWKMSRNSVGHILAFKYSQITSIIGNAMNNHVMYKFF